MAEALAGDDSGPSTEHLAGHFRARVRDNTLRHEKTVDVLEGWSVDRALAEFRLRYPPPGWTVLDMFHVATGRVCYEFHD